MAERPVAVTQWADITPPLLTIRNLSVRNSDLIGVSDVSLEVPAGSVMRSCYVPKVLIFAGAAKFPAATPVSPK